MGVRALVCHEVSTGSGSDRVKVDFLTPKAFHNSAQGNTLGLGRAVEPTLKALNNDRMHNPQVNEVLNPYRVINPFGIFDPRVLPWAELGNAFGVWRSHLHVSSTFDTDSFTAGGKSSRVFSPCSGGLKDAGLIVSAVRFTDFVSDSGQSQR